MNSTQALFWAIALPVTVSIGALSLVAAYGHNAIVNVVQRSKDEIRMKRSLLTHHQSLANRNQHRMDEERAGGSNDVETALRQHRVTYARSDPWLNHKRWSQRKQNPVTEKRDANGRPIVVRTWSDRDVHENSTRGVRAASVWGGSKLVWRMWELDQHVARLCSDDTFNDSSCSHM